MRRARRTCVTEGDTGAPAESPVQYGLRARNLESARNRFGGFTMMRTAVLAAMTAGVLLLSATASADSKSPRWTSEHRHQQQDWRHERRGDRDRHWDHRRDGRDWDRRHDDRRWDNRRRHDHRWRDHRWNDHRWNDHRWRHGRWYAPRGYYRDWWYGSRYPYYYRYPTTYRRHHDDIDATLIVTFPLW